MSNSNGIVLKKITYGELKDLSYDVDRDRYKIIADYFNEPTREALLSNPNYDVDSKTVLNIVIYNGEIVGRHMLMPTRVKVADQWVRAQTGGGHEIHDSFQGKGLGTAVVRDTIMNSEYPIYIGQLYSSGAISILRKMDLCIFEKPLYFKQRKVRSNLIAKGYSGFLLFFGSLFGDFYLKLLDIPNYFKLNALKHKYVIKREERVPDWVDSFVLNDGHKYMEVHDQKWLQWNLDHIFTINPGDKNFFFAVYDKKGDPAGFYMTKERFEENKKGVFKNLVRGTVVEWGSRNESELTETDINLMALSTFSPNVDKINTVISTDGIGKDIERMGYSYRGMYQMTFKPDDGCNEDMKDQNQWRIRYGGCNTILV